MKKIICLLLALTMLLTMFAGCKKADAEETAAEETTAEREALAEKCRNTIAVTMNGETYSAATISYYYGGTYMTFMDNYGSYASYLGLDTDSGILYLDLQSVDDETTWKDYFVDGAMEQLQTVAAFADLGESMGLTLSDSELQDIEESIDTHKDYADYYEYDTLDEFLEYNYGTGVNEDILRTELQRYYLAVDAYSAALDQFSYTDEEVEAYYDSLDGAQDYFTYAYACISTDADGDGTVTEEELAAAKSAADAVAEAANTALTADPDRDRVTALNDALAANGQTVEAASYVSQTGSLTGNAYAEWIAQQTEPGDVEVFADSEEDPTCYYIACLIYRDDNHYALKQIRCILLLLDDDSYGYTEESYNENMAKAEMLLDGWKSGDATEESFAALADSESEDTVKGGLYSSIDRYTYIDVLTDFAYGDHVHGDTDIVYAETAGYYGLYILYYVGDGEQAYMNIARELMEDEAADTLTSETIAPYTYEYNQEGYDLIGYQRTETTETTGETA